MTRTRLFLLAGALVLCASSVGYQAHALNKQHARFSALQHRHASLQRELAAALARLRTAREELAAAERQLIQLPLIALESTSHTHVAPSDPVVAGWLGRTRQLRTLLEQHPDHFIPEMRSLTAEDWLRVAREAKFDTEDERREALAWLRHAAKLRFVPILSRSAQNFTLAYPQSVPVSPADLLPYFETPIAPDILARFEIKPDDTPNSRRPRWSLREIAPVDEDHDQRIRIDSTGSHATQSGFLAWHDDYSDRLQNAFKAFAAAHPQTKMPTVAQLTPHIQPPLPPAVLEKLLQQERDRR